MGRQRDTGERFQRTFEAAASDVLQTVRREVFGPEVWVNGYTTAEQVDLIAERLALRTGALLLDIGSGEGWPTLRIVQRSGCRAVLTDVPEVGLRTALRRAARCDIAGHCAFARAGGADLPFRSHTFDAAVHTDAL